MLDSDIRAIQELCRPHGPAPLTCVGTLYGTGTPCLVLRSTVSFCLYAVATLSEFDILSGVLMKD